MENINKNKKSVEKLFSSIDQILEEFSYYIPRFAENCLSQLITFFHSKERFDLVVRLAEKFSYSNILEAECVFEVAYAFTQVNNKRQAKNYYRGHLRDVGENFAVANNLALLEEDSGNLAEAERLLQLAMKLDTGSEKAKANHERVMKRIQEEEEKKQAYQKAADLYQQESDTSRLLAAKLYSLRDEDGLVLYNSTRFSSVIDQPLEDVDYQVEDFLRKKYFDEISSKTINFNGRILRPNPAVVVMLESDLKKFEERDALKAIANELLSENLNIKYGYNQSLLDNLRIIKSSELLRMLERDVYETVIALAVKSYKSAIILCGSIAEAVLLDALLAQKDAAINALEKILSREGRHLKNDDALLNRWVLDRLLDVAMETKLISENLYHWGHGLRGFRNLVHPGVEQRQSIEVSRENAEMSWNVVKRLLAEIKANEEQG